MKPKLYVLVGISSSGKSTIAKQLAKENDAVIISSDAIRAEICDGNVSDQSKNEEVFKIFHKRIKENLLKGNNVITDATNIKIKSRRAILECTNGIDCEKIAYIIPKTIEQCIRDNNNNDRTPVPDGVIQRQVSQFEIPFYQEGWSEIVIYDNDRIPLDCIKKNLINKMRNFDQKNPHHTEDLFNHCKTVHDEFEKYGYSSEYNIGALLHDCGKLYTQTFDNNGIAHYLQHHNYGSYMLLSSYHLYMRDDEFLDMLFLVNYHMLPFFWTKEKTHEKYKRIFGEKKYQMLIDFNKCDKIRP